MMGFLAMMKKDTAKTSATVERLSRSYLKILDVHHHMDCIKQEYRIRVITIREFYFTKPLFGAHFIKILLGEHSFQKSILFFPSNILGCAQSIFSQKKLCIIHIVVFYKSNNRYSIHSGYKLIQYTTAIYYLMDCYMFGTFGIVLSLRKIIP